MATVTMYPLTGYPTLYLTEDHEQIIIRPMVPQGQEPLLDFFRRVPQEDRFYLKEDITSPRIIQCSIFHL